MNDKYHDLMRLHQMAMFNVASVSFEEYQKINAEYHAHKDACISKYGIEETIRAEFRGVPETSEDSER